MRADLRRALLTALALSASAACSSAPQRSFDADALRARSDQAFDRPQSARSPSRVVKKRAEEREEGQLKSQEETGARTPSAPQCRELSCLDLSRYFAAEGLGEDERSAQEDAVARLSARIESEIESVVKSRYTESERGSSSEGSIERKVTTRFAYGELIRYLPARGEQPRLTSVAYFDKGDYQARLKADYGRALDDLRFQLSDAVAPDASPSLFVQAWRASEELLSGFRRYVQLHQVVIGAPPEGAQEVSELLEQAQRQRRRLLSRAQLSISFKGEAPRDLQGAIASLIQAQLSPWQLRSRVGERCLEGGYLLEVESELKTQTLRATGAPMQKLAWSASLISTKRAISCRMRSQRCARSAIFSTRASPSS